MTDSDLVLCPSCGETGQTSIVTVVGSMRTAMGYQYFYDEEGRGHKHDPNRTHTSYECSRGHRWKKRHTTPCWCGWPNVPQERETIGILVMDPHQKTRILSVERRDVDTLALVVAHEEQRFTTIVPKDCGQNLRYSNAAFDDLERQLRALVAPAEEG